METDYISREAAIDVLCRIACGNAACGQKNCTAYDEMNAVPAADVRPVVRGHYVGDYDGYADGAPVYDIWSCSVCSCVFEDWDEKPTYNFCPYCGADMREEVQV